MDYKKPSFWIVILVVVIVLAIIFSLLSKPETEPTAPTSSSESVSSSSSSSASESVVPVEMGSAKAIDFSIAGKSLTFSVRFPQYISDYVSLNAASALYDNNNEYTAISFFFQKDDQSAAIGLVSIYPKEQYEKMDSQREPVPTKLFEKDNLIVAFQAPQDAPFDPNSELGKLIYQYHSELQSTLDSITITVK